jgi:hypothetical protein
MKQIKKHICQTTFNKYIKVYYVIYTIVILVIFFLILLKIVGGLSYIIGVLSGYVYFYIYYRFCNIFTKPINNIIANLSTNRLIAKKNVYLACIYLICFNTLLLFIGAYSYTSFYDNIIYSQ